MAIKTEYPYINEAGESDNTRIKTYSDEGKPIIKLSTGEKYQEAIDTYPCKYTYIEYEEVKDEENLEEAIDNDNESVYN